MTINNLEYNVPSQVRQLLLSCVPYGSEYVIYTKSYNTQNQVYELIYKTPVTHNVVCYQVSHVAGGSYTLSAVTNHNYTFDSLLVDEPYYAYSSISTQGIVEALPVTSNITAFMSIIICSILVFNLVFGGIRWFARKKYSV